LSVPPWLVFGVGNPSRGDDALGPAFVERAQLLLAPDIQEGRLELLTDFQLQIEHALDLKGRRHVVFVDASLRARAPFEYTRLVPSRDPSHTTHSMSPEAVLEIHREIVGPPPESWLLAIRGESFELGEELSAAARANLDAALGFFVGEAHGGE
jgi:hydrogenase maturation protease